MSSILSAQSHVYDLVNEENMIGNEKKEDSTSPSSRSGAPSQNGDGASSVHSGSPAARPEPGSQSSSPVVVTSSTTSLDNLIASATASKGAGATDLSTSGGRMAAASGGGAAGDASTAATSPSPLLFGGDENKADLLSGANLDCPYCHQTYREPRILNCLHALCEDCIIAQLEGRAEPPAAFGSWRQGHSSWRNGGGRGSWKGRTSTAVDDAASGASPTGAIDETGDNAGGGGGSESGRASSKALLDEELEPTIVKAAKPPPGVIRCPTCKQDSQVGNDVLFVQRMLMDYVTMNMIDAMAIDTRAAPPCETCKTADVAVARCQNCFSFLCTNCVQAHQYMRCFDGHKVVTFDEVRSAREKEGGIVLHRPILCMTHTQQQLQYFCATCQEPVCQECTISTHQLNHNHQVQVIDGTIDSILRDHLTKVVDVAEEKVNESCAAQSQLETKLGELNDQVENARTAILEQFDVYREQLERRKEELLSELNDKHDQLERQTNTAFDDIAATVQKMHDACAFSRRLLAQSNTMELLVSRGRVMEQLSHVFYSMPAATFNVALKFCANPDFYKVISYYAGGFDVSVNMSHAAASADPTASNARIQNLPTAMPPLPMTERPKAFVQPLNAVHSPNTAATVQPPRGHLDGVNPSLAQTTPLGGYPRAQATGSEMEARNLKLLAEALQKMGQQNMPPGNFTEPPPSCSLTQPPPQQIQYQQRFAGGSYTRNSMGGQMADNVARMAANMSSGGNSVHSSAQHTPMTPIGQPPPSSSVFSAVTNVAHQQQQQMYSQQNVMYGAGAATSQQRYGSSSPFGAAQTTFGAHSSSVSSAELHGRQSAYPWTHLGTGAASADVAHQQSGRCSVAPIDPTPMLSSYRLQQQQQPQTQTQAAPSSFSFFGPSATAAALPTTTASNAMFPTPVSSVGGGGDTSSNNAWARMTSPTDATQQPRSVSPPLSAGDSNSDIPVRRTDMASMHIRKKFGQLGNAEGQFNSPHGFCLGQNEEIAVADTNNHRIQFFNKDGDFLCQFGETGKEDGKLWYPRKVAMLRGSQQRFIVCDRGNERSRMQIFKKNGQFEKKIMVHYMEVQVVLGQQIRKQVIRYMDIVAGLAVDTDGNIVAVDSVTPTIFRINPESGELLKWFDISAQMKEPSDIAVHGSEYFVCDFKGHCVCVFSDSGGYLRRIGGQDLTSFPNGIDVSDDGDVLVGDSHGNRFHVVIYKRDAQFVTEFECPYVKVGYLRRIGGQDLTSFPNGIDASDDGDVLVGDSHGNRFHVVIYRRDAQFVTEFECPYVKVGYLRRIGGQDLTSFPNGIDVSDDGDVLVGDSHGNRFHVVIYKRDAQFVTEFECPYVKVGYLRRIGGQDLTSFPNGIDASDDGDVLVGDSHGNRFHVVIYRRDAQFVTEFECPYVKVGYLRRIGGQDLTSFPNGIDVSDVLVGDSHGNRFHVVIYKRDAQFVTEFECPYVKVGYLRRIGGQDLTSFPNGIDVSDDGDVLVGDSHGNRFHVVIYKREAQFVTEFECPYVKVGYLRRIGGQDLTSFPNGIDVSDDGDVLVGDSHGNRLHVVIYKRDAQFVTEFECPYVKVGYLRRIGGQDLTSFPNGIDVSDVLFGDSHGNRFHVVIYKRDAQFVTEFECPYVKVGYLRRIGGQDLTSFPNGIDVSDDGDVLVGDSHGNRFHVVIYKRDAQFVTEFECPYVKVGYLRRIGGQDLTSFPNGIDVSDVLVGDSHGNRFHVVIYKRDAQFVTEFECPYVKVGYLRRIGGQDLTSFPNGIDVSDVLVGDSHGNRFHVVIYKRDAQFVTEFECPYVKVGYLRRIGGQDLTSFPNGIDVSDDGDVLVGDSHGNRFHVVIYKRDAQFVTEFECPYVKVGYLRRIGGQDLTSFPNGIDVSDDGDVLVGDSYGNRFHVVIYKRDAQFVTEFECPYVKVSRCCGLRITTEGYVITLAKNNHHVLVLDTLYVD